MQAHVPEQRIGTLVWRGKWIIVVCLVVSMAIAVAVTKVSTKVYEATAIFQISTPNAQPGDSTDLANQGLAKNYATLIVSPGFLGEIRKKVEGGSLTTQELEGKLNAQALEQTALLELKAHGGSPGEARRLATEVASGFLASLQRGASDRTRARQAEIDKEIRQQSARIPALQRQVGRTPGADIQLGTLRDALVALRKQSATLVANGFAQGGSATLAAAPTASPNAVSPRPALNLLAGLVLGALLGLLIVITRERLHPALSSAEDAAKMLAVPVLTSIPLRRRAKSGDPVLTEAYEMLCAQISLSGEGKKLKVVTITSFSPGEGKTSVVEGIARSTARGGRRTLMIDGDLRMGSLSKRLGQEDGRDLVDVLEGSAPLENAVRNLTDELDLLPAISTPSNPPALLNGSSMRHLLASLESRYDLVLLDSPPLAHLADASILASLSDGTIMVVRSGVSKPADLVTAQSIVRRADGQLLGIAVFEPGTIDKTYYPSVAITHDLAEDAGARS